jgi:hypothetical protein
MREADRLVTDGEAYERPMGRWSRIVAEALTCYASFRTAVGWHTDRASPVETASLS